MSGAAGRLHGRATVIKRNWWRCLLSALGACELLMAAGAPLALTAVGAVGGVALTCAAWRRGLRRSTLLGLLVVGTVPFALLAWTAIVPILLLVTVATVAAPLVRDATGRPETRA